jgi:hypothetical protein
MTTGVMVNRLYENLFVVTKTNGNLIFLNAKLFRNVDAICPSSPSVSIRISITLGNPFEYFFISEYGFIVSPKILCTLDLYDKEFKNKFSEIFLKLEYG